MAIAVTFNGTAYSVPEEDEAGWEDLTGLLVDVANNAATSSAPPAATNASFSQTSSVPTVSVPIAGNGQTATVTLGGGRIFQFAVGLNTGEGLILVCNFAVGSVTAPSDPSGLFLATDAGTGIYVFKSASSGTISFKNRMGAGRNIDVRCMTNTISSSTAWS